jgi:LysR family nitrogen assimilation transcriptional regulator
MDTRFLRSFLCIAQTGSLSRAAAALDIVQPALSRQVRILEQELGTQLLVRHRRGIVLTEAGDKLREHAGRIIAALDEARHAVSTAGDEPSGRLAIGLPNALLDVVSANLAQRFNELCPRVFLSLLEAPAHVIESYLREGRLDAAVLLSPKPVAGIVLEPLITENVYLAGPAGSNLDIARPTRVEAFARLPMLMFPPHDKLRQSVDDIMGRNGVWPEPSIEIEGLGLTIAMIRRGMGYALLPQCVIHNEIQRGGVTGSPIVGATITWQLGIQRARAGTRATEQLAATLRNIVAAQVETGIWSHGRSAGSRLPAARAKPRSKKP